MGAMKKIDLKDKLNHMKETVTKGSLRKKAETPVRTVESEIPVREEVSMSEAHTDPQNGADSHKRQAAWSSGYTMQQPETYDLNAGWPMLKPHTVNSEPQAAAGEDPLAASSAGMGGPAADSFDELPEYHTVRKKTEESSGGRKKASGRRISASGRNRKRTAGRDPQTGDFSEGLTTTRKQGGKAGRKRSAAQAAVRQQKGKTGRKTSAEQLTAGKKGRSRAQKQKIRPIFWVLLVAAVAVAAVVILLQNSRPAEETLPVVGEDLVVEPVPGAVTAEDVLHLSFPSLLTGAEWRQEGSEAMTTEEFGRILQNLYDRDYVLVDFYDLLMDVELEDGTVRTVASNNIDIPDGKKPLILSQRNVCYPLEGIGSGYAARLTLDESGNITAELRGQDGSVSYGAYDCVPILEEFIAEHPDFSVDGARMVLGVTGSQGVLGYRTLDYFGLTSEEGNPYGAYGVFDVSSEKTECKKVIKALKEKGYHFASNGFGSFSYGSEQSLMENDASQWDSFVAPLVGDTDILMLPDDADIGSWSGYTEDNAKFTYLKDLGFYFYLIKEESNRTWLQSESDYMREGIHKVNTYSAFTTLMDQFADQEVVAAREEAENA